MDLEDKGIAKVFVAQAPPSSSQSTPEKRVLPDGVSRGEYCVQEYLKSDPKKELRHTCFDNEQNSAASKCKILEQFIKTSNKRSMNQDMRKAFSNQLMSSNHTFKKHLRKGEHPVRFAPPTELSPDVGCANTWVCKNSACRALLTANDTFCKRCSCCICHLFDDNKDPSLWLVCSSECGEQESCGLTCHIECALQRQKIGVVDLGQLMKLDGSYCCPSCGKVSGILGCWKKQLVIARDARRVDVLCHRISLSHRLLDGTSRFKELHEIVVEAKAKLENEVGPVNGVSARMARGIVSRLSVSSDIHRLCSLAIEKANAWLTNLSKADSHNRGTLLLAEDSLPAACRFKFEEVAASSLIIVLKEFCSTSTGSIKGYKLWYCKCREESHSKEPVCIFPRTQRRVLISNLQPCTEYTFRIISYTDAGDFGHSEAKCFTKSVEIIHKTSESEIAMDHRNESSGAEGSFSAKGETNTVGSSGFKVRHLGKVLRLAWAQEQGSFDGCCSADMEECCGVNHPMMAENVEEGQPPYVSRELVLNAVSVPDLNAYATPIDSRDEDIGCTSEQVVEAEDDVVSHGTAKNGVVRSNGSADSQTWLVRPIRGVPAVDSRTTLCKKRVSTAKEEAYDGDSTLINGSPLKLSSGSDHLDESYEYCVKVIRWLECEGHIKQEFRMEFLTWFSLRSTERERRVVITFIHTLIDDPSSLAGQLVDSFLETISNKRPRNDLCSKLWH